ncbi:elongation factor 1-beta [Candidatus Woesearchaeota archaeon]|jgi:elongation factor 1-beta|nr:elongation factor 1-beta [Candidatus Woesearchaeota archaeon]MBT4114642.1 elongation factor 1-beta [Candidatus Woesearchaeota archaeon]MBT4248016.1 elongation factor 1-beta [Candidatus Woesearchaeota archaeon]
MAKVYVKVKIMPESPDIDLGKIETQVKKIVENDGSKYHVSEIKPIAFGLNSLEFIFMRDESKGDTEPMEKEFVKISGVQSVDVIDVRRAFG